MASNHKRQKYLPIDMLIDVLCRVPVMSLVVCRCVCKTWKRTIDSNSFVKDHLSYQKAASSNTNKYILYRLNDSYTLLTDYEPVFYKTKPASKLNYSALKTFQCCMNGREKRILGTWGGMRIQGICDGLLCLSDEGYHIGENIYLWNPICRKAKKLPQLEISIKLEDNVFTGTGGVSFGYYDDDYKVIVISPVDHKYIVSVYTLSSNSWSIIQNKFDHLKATSGFLTLSQPTRFVNCTAYMIEDNCLEVVSFDLKDETLEQFKLPAEAFPQHPHHFSVEVYGETIAALGYDEFEVFSMWILLRDNSWEKKFQFELQHDGRDFIYPVGFLHDGKYLVKSVSPGLRKFYLWDLESHKFTEFRSFEYGSYTGRMDSNCMESLLLLNEANLDPLVHAADHHMDSSCS